MSEGFYFAMPNPHGYNYEEINEFEELLKERFYIDRINLSESRSLRYCTGTNTETGEKSVYQLYNSTYEALEHHCVCYKCFGKPRSISYRSLIENLPVIDFRFLLKTIDSRSINEKFVKIFRVNELYISELCDKLDLNEHESLIDIYAEELDWNAILSNNIPLSNEHIKKYFNYICKESLFYFDKGQTFDKDILKFIFEELCNRYSTMFRYCMDFAEFVKKFLKSHNLTESELEIIIKVLKKSKLFKGDSYIITRIIDDMLEYQNVSEKFCLKLKLFRKHQSEICHYGHLSEDFIEENCDDKSIINWEFLSKNELLLFGIYSDEFYKKYSDRINWEQFDSGTLKEFSKDNMERFRDFLFKFKHKISRRELKHILRYSYEGKSLFTVPELVKYFKDEILSDKIRDSHDYGYMSETYLLAIIKLNHPDFSLKSCLSRVHLTKNLVLTLKKDIFDLMLSEPDAIEKHKADMITKIINNARNKENDNE